MDISFYQMIYPLDLDNPLKSKFLRQVVQLFFPHI